MVVGSGPSRVRDFTSELAIGLAQVIPLDGPDQEEATKATLQEIITFISTYLGTGGGGTTNLANLGSGAGVYAGLSGTVAQLRSLRSTTSALVVTQATNDIVFTISSASITAAGLMSASDKIKLDALPGSLPLATADSPGLMSDVDKARLDGLPGSIPNATITLAGFMSAADKVKLNGLPSSVETVQVGTVGTGVPVYGGKVGGIHQIKSIISNSPPLTVTDSSGDIILSIASVTPSNPGLMSAADKTKLDILEVGGGGTPVDPLPGIVDFTLNNNTSTQINMSADAPAGTWLLLSDANDPNITCLVIVDFVHALVAFYSNPGGGIDLVASYGKFKATTGVLNGTTGPAGFINVSATVDYNVHLENRTGVNMVLRYFQTGGGSTGGAVSLGQLVDVDLTGLANGYVLTYNQTIGQWVPAVPTGGTGGGGDYPRDAAFDQMSVGDEITGARTLITHDAGTGTFQMTAFLDTQSSVFEFDASGNISFGGVSLNPALDVATTLALCQQYRDQSVAARDASEGFSDLSRRWASDPVGSPISGGAQSSFAYSQIGLQNSLQSRILPSRIITDADIVSGKYTLRSGDLFLILVFRNTLAVQLVCPPNLWLNTKGEAWVMLRREGALVTAVNAVGATTSPIFLNSRSILRRFPTELVAPIDITEVLTLPAMTNGKILVSLHSVHATTGAKNLILVSPTVGMPTPAVVWSDASFVGASEALKQNMWQFDIASYAGGDVGFRLTLPTGALAALGTITAINNAGTREDTLQIKSTGVTSSIATGSTSTNGQSRMTLGTFAQRSHTALPAILSGGMFQDIMASTLGTATGDDSDRFGNIGCVSGYEIVPDIAARNYGAAFKGADGPTSALYCAYPPFSTASVSSLVRAAGADPTIALADGVAMLHASPDGLTYFFNAG